MVEMYNKNADSTVDKSNLKSRLTPEQYRCTQESGTEKPFNNAYWNHHEDGIYVDVVSGEPLFSSLHKYESGSGWPSFTQPIDSNAITKYEDDSHDMNRIEVRSSGAHSHLGHVFNDGPGPTYQRYCINSASLRFVSISEMKSQGYEQYLFYFSDKKHWQVATLSGGCFWGMEELLRRISGVISTQVGYIGGEIEMVSYEQVKTGTTGHAEAVQVLFDPEKISYEQILLEFFKMHDPTTKDRQGNDIGNQYRSAIFYADDSQKKIANSVKLRVEQSGAWGKGVAIVTEIRPGGHFWRAESYHQGYLLKHPQGYSCHFIRSIHF